MLVQWFGPAPVGGVEQVLLAVRGKRLLHRVPGIKPNLDTMMFRQLPHGLAYDPKDPSGEVFVNDWEWAEADWTAGTVGGWRPHLAPDDVPRRRLSVEVLWGAAAAFVAVVFPGWRRVRPVAPPSQETTAEAASRADAAADGRRLRRARRQDITNAIRAVYEHAKRNGMKPPNINELPPLVINILAMDGIEATTAAIKTEGEKDEFKGLRQKTGARVNRSLAGFSLKGWGKSGPES